MGENLVHWFMLFPVIVPVPMCHSHLVGIQKFVLQAFEPFVQLGKCNLLMGLTELVYLRYVAGRKEAGLLRELWAESFSSLVTWLSYLVDSIVRLK